MEEVGKLAGKVDVLAAPALLQVPRSVLGDVKLVCPNQGITVTLRKAPA